jgi:hypothetical protein
MFVPTSIKFVPDTFVYNNLQYSACIDLIVVYVATSFVVSSWVML